MRERSNACGRLYTIDDQISSEGTDGGMKRRYPDVRAALEFGHLGLGHTQTRCLERESAQWSLPREIEMAVARHAPPAARSSALINEKTSGIASRIGIASTGKSTW